MKSRIFGIIFIFYSALIAYLYFFHILGSFLAPKMQIYILASGPVFLILGICSLFFKSESKFHISDFILLLPLLAFLLMGDGKLSTNFLQSRRSSLSNMANTSSNVPQKIDQDQSFDSEKYKDVSFKKVDFDITDEVYMGLSDYITYGKYSDRAIGKTIRVRGFIVKSASYVPEHLFAIGKYLISCCVADAGFGGYFAKSEDNSFFEENGWYEIEGVLEYDMDTYGNNIPVIHVVNAKEIPSKGEELYVYPCYSYGDGSCQKIIEYHLN